LPLAMATLMWHYQTQSLQSGPQRSARSRVYWLRLPLLALEDSGFVWPDAGGASLSRRRPVLRYASPSYLPQERHLIRAGGQKQVPRRALTIVIAASQRFATPSSNSSLGYPRNDARAAENGFAAKSSVNKNLPR